ncbi:MAG: acyl-CoA dehydrogenase, partial [Desulfobacteraceae bacterium]|nr:acyl-CoA dehydrogenase [Desulfobacteraceae bacterium]
FWSDLALELPRGKEKDHYENLCDFMTPIIKAYCSDTGFKVCEQAVQCLGGYGYCRDYPLEQYLRDVKIMSLYEGTNGIQAMDLLGRKMSINSGAPFNAYKAEMEKFTKTTCENTELDKRIQELSKAAELLFKTARKLGDKMAHDPLQWASYSYPALTCFGELTIVWRLLDMAVIAHELQKKKPSDYLRG